MSKQPSPRFMQIVVAVLLGGIVLLYRYGMNRTVNGPPSLQPCAEGVACDQPGKMCSVQDERRLYLCDGKAWHEQGRR